MKNLPFKKLRWVILLVIIVFILVIISIPSFLRLPQTPTWEKTIRGWGGDMDECIQQTSDGGYITVVNSNITFAGTFTGEIMNFSLVKMDGDGDILWAKTYKPDNSLFEYFTGCSVQQTTDEGYVTAATVFPFSRYFSLEVHPACNADSDCPIKAGASVKCEAGGNVCAYEMLAKIYLMKTDPNGSKLWESYIGDGYVTGYSVQQTSDGGYAILGWAPFGEGGIHLVKTDALGNMTWQKYFGGDPKSQAYSFKQTSDGGYIIAGRSEILLPIGTKIQIADGSEIPRASQMDAYIVKTDAYGDKLWEKKYAEKLDETWDARSIEETSDGGYVVVGSVHTADGTFSGQYLRKIDGNGDLVWEKIFSRRNYSYVNFYSIQQTSDGGYVIAGLFYFDDGNIYREHGYSKPYLMKTDKDGNMIWEKAYEEKLLYNGNLGSVKQTSDGGYIAAGNINYGGNEVSRIVSDIFIVKTDANGNV